MSNIPGGRKPIKVRWIFKVKKERDGSIARELKNPRHVFLPFEQGKELIGAEKPVHVHGFTTYITREDVDNGYLVK
jgi:hypothetical protein